MNYDVLTLIFLRLPLQSLLILRTVCKFWCDVIDSQYFRKLHTQRLSKCNDEYAVHLQCYFLRNCKEKTKLCIEVLANGISLKSYDLPAFDMDYARVSGSVKGLICVSSFRAIQPIAICNPFLGQLKILPRSPSSSCHSPQCIIRHHVGVGFDEDYKVVQLVSCQQHRRLQANLYLKRTNSWRELTIDQELVIDRSITSFYKYAYGSFAHWRGGLGEERIILSFDMKNEVFQTITLPDEMVASEYEILVCNHACHPNEIFSLCVLENGFKLRVYESTEVRSGLISWHHALTLDPPYIKRCITPTWISDDGVLKQNMGYWVCLKMFPPMLNLDPGFHCRSDIVEHEYSFIIEYTKTFLSP